MARCMNCMEEYEGFDDICPKCGFDRNTPPKEIFHLYPGTELMERYIVGTVVGFGGFGIVYKAWDTLMMSVVAIKEYFPVGIVSRNPREKHVNIYDNRKNEEYMYGKERFLNEARIMAKFNTHPNIVNIFDFFEENNTGYIVMEYLEGVSLKQYLLSENKPLDIETAISITESMCDILSVIHKEGIIHRDISPDNIFICLGGKIKLLDFGASRLPKINPNLTKILKPGYAPAEQYSSEKVQGNWTDVYALGATLYRMVTGQVPPESPDRSPKDILVNPIELNREIPEYLSTVILRAMAINYELRYKNMIEFKRAIRNEKGVRNETQELNRRKRNRLISIMCVVGILVIGGVSSFLYYQNQRKMAQLPSANLDVWFPISDDTDVDKMYKVIEEFNNNYGEHIKINLKGISWENYEKTLSNAKAKDTLPEIFYTKYLNDYKDESHGLASALKKIDKGEIIYFDEVKECADAYNAIPTGVNCYVLYENTKFRTEEIDVSEAVVNSILSNQTKIGEDKYYTDFIAGNQQFYIGSTEKYYEILGTKNIFAYIAIHDISNICSYGYLTDYWCISKNSNSDERTCAEAIIYYLMEENCQRLFFTVDSTRMSTSMPINKRIFDVNYYENNVAGKMEFINKTIGKFDLYKYSDEEDFYKEVLK